MKTLALNSDLKPVHFCDGDFCSCKAEFKVFNIFLLSYVVYLRCLFAVCTVTSFT